MKTKIPPTAYIALLLGTLIIGSSAIWIRLADAPGPITQFYRMALGALTLAIPFFLRLRKTRLSKREAALALLAGLFFGLDLAAWSTGVKLSGATVPTLMANLAPIWVGLGTWLIFKQRLSFRFWLGLCLALLGALFVLELDFHGNTQVIKGALYGLTAAFFYGTYFLIAEKSRKQLDALSFFWLSTSASAITLLALTQSSQQALGGYTVQTYWIFILLGVVIQGAGWLLISFSQGQLPAALVSPTLLAQPLLTAVFAAVFLKEILSPLQLLGGAAVVAGIFIVHGSLRKDKKEKTRV